MATVCNVVVIMIMITKYVCNVYVDCCVCICYAHLGTFVVHHAHPPTPPSVT